MKLTNLHTWPERIWLQHGDDGDPIPPFTDEATWCHDHINDSDIEYVRADLAKPLAESAVAPGECGSDVRDAALEEAAGVAEWAYLLWSLGKNDQNRAFSSAIARDIRARKGRAARGMQPPNNEPNSDHVAVISAEPDSVHLAVASAGPESRVPDIQWRKLLAITYCGFPALYCDDGELQDNRTHPFIDFKRDSADEIWGAMRRRTTSALQSGATLPNTAGQPNEQNDVVQEGKQ